MTEIMKFSPAELDDKKAKLSTLREYVDNIQVTDKESLDTASYLLKGLLSERDSIEAMRTAATQPLNKSLREINGWFKPVRGNIDRMVTALKQGVGEYVAEQRRLEAAAYKAAQKALTSGEDAREHIDVALTADTVASSGSSIKMVWTFEVADENAVPRDYLQLDEKKLSALAKKCTEEQPPGLIPGIIWKLSPRVTTRRK